MASNVSHLVGRKRKKEGELKENDSTWSIDIRITCPCSDQAILGPRDVNFNKLHKQFLMQSGRKKKSKI